MERYGYGIYCVLIVTTFLLSANFSQAQFSLNAEIRPRAEFRDGYRTLAEGSDYPAAFISQRSRLNLHYTDTALETHIALQDVRVWGDEIQLQDVPSAALHEAWGKIRFSGQWSLKLGRQELVYGNHRLLGNVNWIQQARSHDAAVIQWTAKDWQIDVGGAYNQMRENILGRSYTLNNYKTLGFLWVKKVFSEDLQVSLAGISDGFQNSDSTNDLNFRYTGGPVINYTPGNLLFHGEAYVQAGKTPSGNDLSAFFFSVNAGYQAQDLTTKAGIDYSSGTDAGKTGESHTFNTLYATNHKFYGHMDYFLNIGNDTRNGGLQDVYLKTSYQVSDKAGINLHGHYFSLINTVSDPSDPTENLNKDLGLEVDGICTYSLNEMVTIKAGYAISLPTESLEALKGGNANHWQHWGWVMVQMKPVFVKQ